MVKKWEGGNNMPLLYPILTIIRCVIKGLHCYCAHWSGQSHGNLFLLQSQRKSGNSVKWSEKFENSRSRKFHFRLKWAPSVVPRSRFLGDTSVPLPEFQMDNCKFWGTHRIHLIFTCKIENSFPEISVHFYLNLSWMSIVLL